MTENQLKYLAYQETMRHNAATEGQAAAELAERNRANLVQESQGQQKLDETGRANRVHEEQQDRHLGQVDRQNDLAQQKYVSDTVFKAIDTTSQMVSHFVPI